MQPMAHIQKQRDRMSGNADDTTKHTQRSTTMQTTTTPTMTTQAPADSDEDREAVAARLERLARRVRAGRPLDAQTFDQASDAIVQLSHILHEEFVA
jgi:hypothetical protein